MTGIKGMTRDHIIPITLPCGCNAVAHGNAGKGDAFLLHDGTRICKNHGKRYRLVYEEIKIGDEEWLRQ